MPRKKKEKSKEEKTAEEFFKIDESDLKYTVEKLIKKNPKIEQAKKTTEKIYSKLEKSDIEKIEKSRKRKKKKTTTKTKKTKSKKFSPEKISLKKNSYELIITEKPQAANKIANALGKTIQKYYNKIPYYETKRDNQTILIGCAVGHLFTLNQNSPGSSIPVFDISWKPNFLVRKKDFTKKYYDTLLKLIKNAGSLTVATDYDVEGEVIGLNIIKFIANQKDASRMKFSTLTEKEINNSYENKSSTLNWGQAIAGETRHYLDWFYGINFSRALMNAIKSAGSFKIMSIGRVQGPTLNFIVQKEKEIQKFKPAPYWQIFITISDNKNKLELKYIKDISKKSELEKFENLKNKIATVETTKNQEKIPPRPPFNLTNLQTEAYKLYGITPAKTLQIAQSLYLNGLISYPRTSSQKLPESIPYKEILNKLAKEYKAEHLIKKQKPLEGKKSDPAHPSIYPTGNRQILSGNDEKIYNLIVKRFLCLFCENAIIENKKIRAITKENLIFSAKGSSILKKAWIEIYPLKQKEVQIPDFNGEVKIIDSQIREKQTQPPKRYSPASILSLMEKKDLGTKATRSSILETLYNRGYIQDQSIKATPLGISLINTLEKYSPIIINEALTHHFEKEMDSISNSKKNFAEKQEKIIQEAKKTITKISEEFKQKQEKIGKELIKANQNLREQQKIENKLMQCPKCKKGNLAITYSKKTKRYFIACDAYPECKNTFSLPPNGLIKKTNKTCEHCNWPMLMRLSKGKRPWIFCFNPECKSNEKWAKKKNKQD